MIQLLKNTYHADGIVFASPIYYSNVTAQLRLFWERLMFPGPSSREVPTAVIYTMSMDEGQRDNFIGEQFEIDLETARQAGRSMAAKLRA